jgi:hypothetical protein
MNPETKYHSTFTILAIIKLFSINADFFSKLAVHNVESFRNYIKIKINKWQENEGMVKVLQ